MGHIPGWICVPLTMQTHCVVDGGNTDDVDITVVLAAPEVDEILV